MTKAQMTDNRNTKQKAFDRKISQELNFALFGIKPKKRHYLPSEDYYLCEICKTKLDKKICDECGKEIHCGQPLTLKNGYLIY